MTDRCRRPIEANEVPFLLDLGQTLQHWRRRAGMTQSALAESVAMSDRHIWRLEHGRRRTRSSTLDGIARAIAVTGRRNGAIDVPSDVILDALVAAAGPTLAPETSKSVTSIERKRKRRRKADLRHDLTLIRAIVDGPDAEPVGGGPLLFLARRTHAALDALAHTAG